MRKRLSNHEEVIYDRRKVENVILHLQVRDTGILHQLKKGDNIYWLFGSVSWHNLAHPCFMSVIIFMKKTLYLNQAKENYIHN